MYAIIVKEDYAKKIDKLRLRNPKTAQIIEKKLEQILLNPYHFKPLRGDMKNIRRVHIDKSFVLTYEILEEEKVVKLLDFEHHDIIYR